MSIDYPIETLAGALHAACLRDLPDIHYRDRDWAAHRKAMDALSTEEKPLFTRRNARRVRPKARSSREPAVLLHTVAAS